MISANIWVPFWWKAWIKKTVVLFRLKRNPFPVFAMIIARLTALLFLQFFWLLDELLCPGWRKTSLRGPLFIIGHQRSGTTVLHRMLVSGDSMKGLTLQEMLMPSITFQRLVTYLVAWDNRHGQRIRKVFSALQTRLFSDLDALHRTRFDEIEEDEFVLWTIFSSAMCANDSPYSSASEKLGFLRDFKSWSDKRQTKSLTWYQACLQKKAYREYGARGGWLVSKNPAFSQKIPLIRKFFPDACFVLLVRDPIEAIPSRLSLISAIWKRRFPEFQEMTSQQVENIYGDSVQTYLSPETDLLDVPSGQKMIIEYEEVKKDPVGVANNIMTHFGIDGTVIGSREKKYRSQHEYSLDSFFVSEDRIRKDLSVVFAHHNYDNRYIGQ